MQVGLVHPAGVRCSRHFWGLVAFPPGIGAKYGFAAAGTGGGGAISGGGSGGAPGAGTYTGGGWYTAGGGG